MFLKQEFNLIVTIVDRGFSDPVITSARSAGAEGATIITARGAGIHETDTFMGVAIQPEKEMVLILVKKLIRKKVMREICKSCGLTDEGKGMCFSVPVDEIGGITHLMGLSKKKGVADRKPTAKKDKNEDKIEKEQKQVEKTDTAKKEIVKVEKAEKSPKDEKTENEKTDKAEKIEENTETKLDKKTKEADKKEDEKTD